MHSPMDDSPSSTPSSGSPPPEEVTYTGPTQGVASQFVNLIASGFAGAAKRRLPTGPTFASSASSASRDPKPRRRADPTRAGSGHTWEGHSLEKGRREKDELIDNSIVEYLRKQIGDPFTEHTIKHFNRD
ncbi:hypothetical protein BDN72DRAFT_775992 [Pluteus cervinus]|uniref:Uncharacterized protein n=1 Tax=Pluteus cervinus TaxID=181527 RepID=A0ACD3AC94_9AGAR|nr:hypothetical protein BDN72DRAFT_775992 [Pluteus cervinus]